MAPTTYRLTELAACRPSRGLACRSAQWGLTASAHTHQGKSRQHGKKESGGSHDRYKVGKVRVEAQCRMSGGKKYDTGSAIAIGALCSLYIHKTFRHGGLLSIEGLG